MEGKTLARVGAIVFVSIAITVALVEASRPTPQPPAPTAPRAERVPAERDPLRMMLARCNAMGEPAASDAGCLHAWAENRRRFFTPRRRAAEHMPFLPPDDVTEAADTPAGCSCEGGS